MMNQSQGAGIYGGGGTVRDTSNYVSGKNYEVIDKRIEHDMPFEEYEIVTIIRTCTFNHRCPSVNACC